MVELEVTREEAKRIANTSVDWGAVVQNRLARTVVALYDRLADAEAKQTTAAGMLAALECIDRLRSGWTPHVADAVWVMYGVKGRGSLTQPREPMTDAQRAVMESFK